MSRRLLLFAACGALAACGDPPDREAPRVAPLGPEAGPYAGVALRAGLLEHDRGYRALAAAAFGAVTAENDLKWNHVQPERGRFEFEAADRIVGFARRHGKRVRGHTLVWHHQNPGWLEEGGFSREELRGLLRAHIRAVVGRYRGRVAEWDVVNEAVADDGRLRDTLWLRGLGPGYIALAFRLAREADPGARLYYNDYGAEGPGPKARGVRALLRRLLAEGVPVDGVGLQGHVTDERLPGLRRNLRGFAALGLDVVFTEVDVRLPVEEDGAPRGGTAALRSQAEQYRRLGRACAALEACQGFVVWGLDDAHSFVPDAYPGTGAPLLFDDRLRPKPAYEALRAALARR